MGRRSAARAVDGFTLVEILIVVAIIGLIAAIAVPNFMRSANIARGVRVANDLKTFGHAFAAYAMQFGTYPNDTHEVLPAVPEMDEYINPIVFNTETAIGGRYNYEGPDGYPYAGVSVSGSSLSASELQRVDAVVDDGNLSTGRFQVPANGRFTYIIG